MTSEQRCSVLVVHASPSGNLLPAVEHLVHDVWMIHQQIDGAMHAGDAEKPKSESDASGALSAVTGSIAGAFGALAGSMKEKVPTKDGVEVPEKSGGFKLPGFLSPKKEDKNMVTGMQSFRHSAVILKYRWMLA